MIYGLNSDFQKRNVVIYARVSTEHDAQLSALENQVEWYRPILAARPEWTLVDSYIDDGGRDCGGDLSRESASQSELVRQHRKKAVETVLRKQMNYGKCDRCGDSCGNCWRHCRVFV